ncbi:MAG TPA: histidine kinase, partial [Hanamia sp.]
MKRVSLHILFWTVYLAQDTAFAYLADAGVLSHFSTSVRIIIALKVCVGLLLPKIILTYFLLYVMLERIIKQREKLMLNIFYSVLFFTVILLIYRILEVYIIYPFTYEGIRPAGNYFNGASFLFGLMDLGFVSGTAIAIKVIKLQLIAKEKEKLLIKDKLETELKFLKNQTNPHFLFNTLNNIYALARKKSDTTADVVMKLSKILRFMLYETGKKYISIAEEVRLIEDYIDLE